jgi:hypothetical protein
MPAPYFLESGENLVLQRVGDLHGHEQEMRLPLGVGDIVARIIPWFTKASGVKKTQ